VTWAKHEGGQLFLVKNECKSCVANPQILINIYYSNDVRPYTRVVEQPIPPGTFFPFYIDHAATPPIRIQVGRNSLAYTCK